MSLLRARAHTAALAIAAVALVAPKAQTQQPASEVGPKIGEMAPDFTFSGATRYGLLRDKHTLSSYRGNTVVLAFFPAARTRGCTVQMEAYRDQYATLFNNGRKVVVIGISVDPDTTLHSWARDAAFPMLFATDQGGEVGSLYGAYMPDRKVENRLLYVIDEQGKIAYKATPFRAMAADSYSELGDVVDKLSPPPAEGKP